MPSILERFRLALKPVYNYSFDMSDAPAQVLNLSARELYQTQDNLRAVCDFIANSIAQLPIKVYKRDGENDRVRDRDSVAAKLLWLPNTYQTEFEFMRGLALEYIVFGCVYVWLTPDADTDSGYSLNIVPTAWIQQTQKETAYKVGSIRICTHNGGSAVDIPASEFIQFKTYSPSNPSGYLSPISALKQTLMEQVEAGRFRKQLWHSSGRLNAQIIRPKDVQPWDENQRKNFIDAFREAWSTDGGSKAGSIPLLEDGMEIKPFQTSFKEAQYIESVKLSREACAAAYGVNPALIWHTDAQTYASAKDNARAFYADCLSVYLQMFQQRINAFLLPRINADKRTYVEFDLSEKLKGSFEERAAILQSAVGGPWLTINEARADNDLPALDGGDALIVPLNVSIGGQAGVNDTHMEPVEPAEIVPVTEAASATTSWKTPEPIRIKSKADKEDGESMSDLLSAFFERQSKSVLPKISNGGEYWNEERWNKELADDMEPIIDTIADKHGKDAASVLDVEYTPEITRKYLRKMAEGRARAINSATKRKLDKVIAERAEAEDSEDMETPADVFDKRADTDAEKIGEQMATAAACWATIEAAHQAEEKPEFRGGTVEKEWVTGSNPRGSHAAMNGERVPIDANFSNGAYWPGDDHLDAEESCNCNCTVEIIYTRR